MSKYVERVAAGIAVLNKAKPGWHTLIDLDTLDLEITTECILGQVFGSYDAGTEELSISGFYGLNMEGRKLQADYGFDLYEHEYEYEREGGCTPLFWELTSEWVDQIKALSN